VAPAIELVRMLPLQKRLGDPIANLLPPERADGRSAMVPDQRRRAESKPVPAFEQPPADVDIISRRPVGRVESGNLIERPLPERHVAARDVLGGLIVQHDLSRATRRPKDTFGHPVVGFRHDVGPADSGRIGLSERSNKASQPVVVGERIRIEIRDDLSRGSSETHVASRADASVRAPEGSERIPIDDRLAPVGRAVVDDNHFIVGIIERRDRRQTFVERLLRIVEGDDNRHPGPWSFLDARCALVEATADEIVGRLGLPITIHQPEAPFVDETAVLVERIGPREYDRACESVVNRLVDLPVEKLGLSLAPVTKTTDAELRQNEREFAGQVRWSRDK
jgi:hypothetical protein